MGKAVKGVGKAIGGVAQKVAPVLSFVPGVGPLASAAVGGLGALASGKNIGEALKSAALSGVAGFGIDKLGALGGMVKGALGSGTAGKIAGGLGNFAMSPGGQAILASASGALAGATGAFDPKLSQTANAATPMAGNYANYLNSMMGSQSGAQNALQNMLAGRPGDPNSLQQYFGAGMGGNGQADLSGTQFSPDKINVGYTPGQLEGMFDPSMINTQFNGTDVSSQFNPTQFNANFSPEQIAAMEVQGGYNSPQFQQTQLQQLQQINPQQLNYSGPQFQQAQLNSLNLQNLGREALATGPNTMQGFGERGQFGSVVNPQANADAIQQIMGRQQTRDIADLRERFGNQALSTGAAQAEALYRAEAVPRAGLAIDDIIRQNQAQQLTQRGQDIGAWQAGRGMDIQQLGLGTGAADSLNQALVQQRGQDVSQLGLQAQTGLEMNEQQMQLAQMANQFGLDASQLGLNADQTNLQVALQAAGLNQQGALDMNALMAQLGNQQNTFNQNNSQFGAQLGMQGQLANQDAMLRAALANNQNNQFGAQLGLDAQRFGDASNQFAAQQALQAALANQQNSQFGAQFGQQGQQLNNQFSQAAATQALQAAMANQQNQQIASQQGMQAGQMNNQFGLDAAQLMQSGLLQNQQMGNQWNLGLQNIGLGQQQNQMQAQQAALAQLFGGWNNMAGLGIAGAENVVGPSTGAQVAGGIGAAGGLMDIFNKAKSTQPSSNGNFSAPPPPKLPDMSQLSLPIPGANQMAAPQTAMMLPRGQMPILIDGMNGNFGRGMF